MVKLSGLMNACLVGEQRAGQAADGGTRREGQQLEPEGRHAHQLGGVLVLAGGLPGPADAAVLASASRGTAR